MASLTWTATDNAGVTAVDLASSTDGGASYPNVIATGLANLGSYSWTVPNTPSSAARVRATAQGLAYNAGRVLAAAGALQMGALMRQFNGSFAQAGAVITLAGANLSHAQTAPAPDEATLADTFKNIADIRADLSALNYTAKASADGQFDDAHIV